MTIYSMDSLTRLFEDEFNQKSAEDVARKVISFMGFDGVMPHHLLTNPEDLQFFHLLVDLGFMKIETYETSLYNGADYRYWIYRLLPERRVKKKEYTPNLMDESLLELLSGSPLHAGMVSYYELEGSARKLLDEEIIRKSPLDGGTYFLNYPYAKDFVDEAGDGVLVSFIYNELRKGMVRRGPFTFYSRIKREFGSAPPLEYVKELTREAVKLLLAEEIENGLSVSAFERKYHIDVAKYGIKGRELDRMGRIFRRGVSKEELLEEILKRFRNHSGVLNRKMLKEYHIDIYHYGLTLREVILYLRENGVNALPQQYVTNKEAEEVILSYLGEVDFATKSDVPNEVLAYINNMWDTVVSKWDNSYVFKKLAEEKKIYRVKTIDATYMSLYDKKESLEEFLSQKYFHLRGHYIKRDSNGGGVIERLMRGENIRWRGRDYTLKYLRKIGVVGVRNGFVFLKK